MKRKTQLTIMQYVLIICALFTFTVSLLGGMELVTGLPRYSMETSFIVMFVFMLMTGIFMVGIGECRTKLRK
jgi:hypothetical protein